MAYHYPTPKRDEAVIEVLHGKEVPDPYRWMEDPDSEETKEFVKNQNSISQPYINSCEDKNKITEKLTSLWNYPKSTVPHKEGKRFYYGYNSGLQNQYVMYSQETLDSEPKVFFDPNTLSDDGTISLKTSSFSKDGRIWAYGLSQSGSDWFNIHFKNVETGQAFEEVLKKAKFSSLSWTHDNQGIFYGCYRDHQSSAVTNEDTSGRDTSKQKSQKLMYHKIGTSQEDDVVAVEFPDNPDWRIHVDVSDCGQYLIVHPQEGCRDNLVFFANLNKMSEDDCVNSKLNLSQVVYKFEHDFEYVTNIGSKCIFRTNRDAPNYRLVMIDLANAPSDSRTRTEPWPMDTLIPEHNKNVLEWAKCVNQKYLILCYMEDVKNILKVHDLETGNFLYNIPLEIGSVVGFSGKKEDKEVFFKFSSMITPGITYYMDMNKSPATATVFKNTEIQGFDQSLYQVEQIFYQSKDKTEVPMFIASRKDCKRDGSAPCLLYGYGGFNISLTPYFSVSQIFYIHHFGGYLAIPNIRGGGEYGEKWHNGGRQFNKQNGFDDFQAAAEFLIGNKYTCKEKLAIKGGSNGGLLVGACVNQRPDLFGAGIAAVGVMDMLRFHKFTIGSAWCSDFGNPDDKDHFENIIKFSPLHNIKMPKEGEYPAILLTTADHDDRVVPSHTLKFIATLQHELGKSPSQINPLMARIETKAGHGCGKPTTKVIEELVDVFCFMAKALNYKFID